jgi:hypothetical protein
MPRLIRVCIELVPSRRLSHRRSPQKSDPQGALVSCSWRDRSESLHALHLGFDNIVFVFEHKKTLLTRRLRHVFGHA